MSIRTWGNNEHGSCWRRRTDHVKNRAYVIFPSKSALKPMQNEYSHVG